jgi:2-alkyl-3-oxoalkanoate reductase
MNNSDPVFITGASGFIGGKIAERLLADGRSVRALCRRPHPELERLGAEIIPGDLNDIEALRDGSAGAGTVFHVAGRVGVWGPAVEFRRVNLEGTRNVIAACRAAKTPRLIYTSSPSVVYTGRDLRGVDESAPRCTKAPSPYPTSKAAAEREVLAANGASLSTLALRPHLVFGPGDKNLVPRVLALAAQGRLKIVGTGQNRVDLTHISNVVDAHLLAERALTTVAGVADPGLSAQALARADSDAPGSATPATVQSPGGKAYFITNGEPVVLWEWINTVLAALGRPPVTKHVSLPTAYAVGGAVEGLWWILRRKGEPPMTRFVAKELATDHWFDISAARRDLGYQPRVSIADGTAELIALLKKG